MLIIGAGGFAKEVLEIVHLSNQLDNLAFYDDVSTLISDKIFDKFKVLKSEKEAQFYFETIDNKFTIGIGNPLIREKLFHKFIKLGGVYTSTISPRASIGSYCVEIGSGSNILDGVTISNSVKIGKGAIIYYNSIITHDCFIDDFVEISPAAIILGGSKIGSYTQIGANATILPKLTIGKNVIVGAGALVTKNIPDNSMYFGVPAVLKKVLPKIDF